MPVFIYKMLRVVAGLDMAPWLAVCLIPWRTDVACHSFCNGNGGKELRSTSTDFLGNISSTSLVCRVNSHIRGPASAFKISNSYLSSMPDMEVHQSALAKQCQWFTIFMLVQQMSHWWTSWYPSIQQLMVGHEWIKTLFFRICMLYSQIK